jgi:TetR/AcrR family transcriptional regulator, transcriptional repressor for nem operon
MTRTKDFDEQQVLTAAADTFTRLGYHATSFSTLTDALGVGKQSLYNAFGDKASLYLKALEHAASTSAVGQALMQPGLSGLQRIKDFLSVVTRECADPHHPGCMVSHGLLAQAAEAQATAALQSKWSITHELLRATIEDGQRDGSIASNRRSAELAHALMVTMAGLRVLSKAGGTTKHAQAALQSVVELSLEMLQRPMPEPPPRR